MNDVIREVRRDANGTVVCLGGDIDLHQSPGFHQKLVELCSEKPARLILDLSEVNYIDSSGIGTLVEIFRRLNKEGRKLVLVSPSERVRSVLEITKLDAFFEIVATSKQALQS